MAKGSPKTMRFEENDEKYINAFKGENFSDKFHNLVTYFRDSEKDKQKSIAQLDKQILEREKRIRELDKFLNGSNWIENEFQRLKSSIDSCRRTLDKYTNISA